jgi:hypothetical protein
MTLCANDPQKIRFTQATGDQLIYLFADTLGNILDADGPIYLMPIPSSESKRMGAEGPVRLLFTYAENPVPCSALVKMLDTRVARVCPRKKCSWMETKKVEKIKLRRFRNKLAHMSLLRMHTTNVLNLFSFDGTVQIDVFPFARK